MLTATALVTILLISALLAHVLLPWYPWKKRGGPRLRLARCIHGNHRAMCPTCEGDQR